MPPSPELATTPQLLAPADIVRSGLCIGCGVCTSTEPRADMDWDRFGQLKPNGPRDWFESPSTAFSARCPFSPSAVNEDLIALERFPNAPHRDTHAGSFIAAYVGHVGEGEFRRNGSSGGLTSWVATELLDSGTIDAVIHVAPGDVRRDGRYFAYRVSRSAEQVRSGAQSRYYPIQLSEVLREVRATPGRYAVIGIPCFIKAIHLLRRTDPVIAERVTHTLGLFCGHMKSTRMIESFAWQLGHKSSAVTAIDYRTKEEGRPANWYRTRLRLADGGSVAGDWWNFVDGDWGAGFFQNSACNFCDDVVAETADISFGDAWVEPYASDPGGTNVVIVRSPELYAMVETAIAKGRLSLSPVDAEFVRRTQAAGLRHRREGLAYRLLRRRRGIVPVKRVAAGTGGMPLRRRLVYRSREWIAALSHRVFLLARRLDRPAIYQRWGKLALVTYQGLTYSRGRWGRLFDKLLGAQEVR